jgi:hypothetical protein
MIKPYLFATVLSLLLSSSVTGKKNIKTKFTNEPIYDIGCTPFNMNGVQLCTAGISASNLTVIRQQQSEWCWAASISAVFAYYGHPVSQARIVKETFGQIANVPGQPYQIYSALTRTWTDDNGTDFDVNADVLTANAITAIQDLSNNAPLICGTLGHAMVLTALEYYHDVNDHIDISRAIVRDPWPYNNNRRVLTPQEFFNITFLVRISVS